MPKLGYNFRTSQIWKCTLQRTIPLLPMVSHHHNNRYIAMTYPKCRTHPYFPNEKASIDTRKVYPNFWVQSAELSQSFPTRTLINSKNRAPKARNRIYPASPMRTPIDYRRGPSIHRNTLGGLQPQTFPSLSKSREEILQSTGKPPETFNHGHHPPRIYPRREFFKYILLKPCITNQ